MQKTTLAAALLCGALAVEVAAQSPREFLQPENVVRDPKAPIAFRLDPGWTLDDVARWVNDQTTLWFTDAETGTKAALYNRYPLPVGDCFRRPYPVAPLASSPHAM